MREVFPKMSNLKLRRVVVVATILLLAVGASAFAQLQTGNLYGKVTDQQGSPLPGVTVTLDTGAAQEVQVSNAQGEVRFLSLPPGSMKMKAELQGFSTVDYPNIVITVGHNTTLDITMQSAAAIEDVITVTAESPLLDERKISTGATINQTELQKIPTSRDPWSILSSTPGVQVDRVNVGGNESSQQSIYVGSGSMNGNNVWAVDGVVITDMAATGSSPSYYDFDAFQEMQVTTGGSDTTIATGGVVLNLVTKRGTNEWRGSGRYLITPSSTQSNTSFSASNLGPGQPSFKGGNRIDKVLDFGAEVGGPIVKDRLWIWGSYGDQKVNTIALNGTTNKADLPTYNAKVNAQVTSSNSATLFALENDKKVHGRNAGPFRPQETTWNQGHNGPKPTAAKAEDTQIFGPNFYLTGLYSLVNGGFGLFPQGGVGPVIYRTADHVWHNSFLDYQVLRPQKQGKLDASTFFNFSNISNELKYGASYRRVESDSLSTWGPGFIYNNALFGLPAGDNVFIAARELNSKVRTTYTSLYAQDTLTSGNLTANIGVRYDRQGGTNLPSTEAANPANPALLPTFAYRGGPIGFTWTDVTPRLGLTYALGKDRKTLLRASYSRFADQLGATAITALILNPTATQSYYYFTTPQIGPAVPTVLHPGFGYSGNVNPSTGLPYIANGVNRNLSAPITDEVLASVEHAILPELVVGLNLTYRKLHNLLQTDLLVFDDASGDPFHPSFSSIGRPATRADFVPHTITGTLPNGQPFSTVYYTLNPNLVTRNGVFLRNGSTAQEYKGASLVLNKRLSHNWMMRGNFTYSDWKWTNTSSLPDQTDLVPGQRNGDTVLLASGAGSGPKSFVYINSKWSANLNGLYQIAPDRPWGFNVAGNLTAR